MQRIFRYGNEIRFDRIVFYGCSFTAGSELGNEVFLNNTFKSKYSLDDIDYVKRNTRRPDFLRQYINGTIKELDNHSLNMSWTKLLSDMFEVECVNRSIPSGNNQLSIHNLHLDLVNGNVKETDLVIIGISPYQRWMWIDETGDTHKTIFTWDNDWPSKRFYEEFLIYLTNDNQTFYQTYMCLKHIDLLSRSTGGRVLSQFMFKSWCASGDISDKYKKLSEDVFGLDSIIDPRFSFDNVVENWDNDVHGYGHPKQHHHKIMAEYIFKKLSENEN